MNPAIISTLEKSGKYIFAIPWMVIGVQHFMYPDFLENLVPDYMPFRLFWVYFTGVGMIAAAASIIINVKSELAAVGLGVMLTCFIIQLHIPIISADVSNIQSWTRALQDLTIVSIAFMLSGRNELINATRYIYAACIFIFGAQHFLDLKFMTAKAPDYLPLTFIWNWLLGIVLCLAGIGMFTIRFFRISALTIGISLLGFVILQLPSLLADIKNPIKWIIMMLELVISSGAFILISFQKRSEER
jgi:uncharacterized membrane protein